MKVLVVSDVHANIAALNTILEKEAATCLRHQWWLHTE